MFVISEKTPKKIQNLKICLCNSTTDGRGHFELLRIPRRKNDTFGGLIESWGYVGFKFVGKMFGFGKKMGENHFFLNFGVKIRAD